VVLVHQALKVLREAQVNLVQRVTKVNPVNPVKPVNLVNLALRGLPVLKAHPDQQVLLVHKAAPELLDNKDLKARPETKDLKDPMALQVLKDFLEMLVQSVLQALYFNAHWLLVRKLLMGKLLQLNVQVELPQLEAVSIVTPKTIFAYPSPSSLLMECPLLVGKENVVMELVKRMPCVALLEIVILMVLILMVLIMVVVPGMVVQKVTQEHKAAVMELGLEHKGAVMELDLDMAKLIMLKTFLSKQKKKENRKKAEVKIFDAFILGKAV